MSTLQVNQLHQVGLRATELDRAIGFYRDILGLAFIAKFDPPGLAFFELHGTRLLLERGAPPSLLYYRVSDIDAAHQALRGRGIDFVEPPQLVHRDTAGQFGPRGMQEWMASFRDSEDNLVVVVEQRLA